MPTGQQMPQEAPGPANGQSTLHDLFALTDEQILEIEPENTAAAAPSSEAQPHSVIPSERSESRDRGNTLEPSSSQNVGHDSSTPSRSSTGTTVGMTDGKAATENGAAEPPAWLATQMKDPWTGEEAKALWNGVQQAKQEAAAYRAAFATPEEARALKELYPGGVNEARAAAERARVLDDIDRAYFGAAGKSPQEASASRAQLAQMMLREDPAAFREMVFAGLRAIENSSPVGATLGSPVVGSSTDGSTGGASPAPTTSSVVGAQHHDKAGTGAVPQLGHASANAAHVAAYAAFEKAANEDLERSVGAAIARTIEQALPNVGRSTQEETNRAGQAPPLEARLSVAIRQDVEAALKGDRQLGEQIAQILSARRFDNETRAHVVRLIDDRTRQLVPSAAKRVLNDWTQTTLAAHRGKASRADAASARREVAPASLPAGSTASSHSQQRADTNRGAARSDGRRVDYRKLSDEQILDL